MPFLSLSVSLKRIGLIFMITGFLMAGLWWFFTQPAFPPRAETLETSAAVNARLERHVRMLSEEFYPRDVHHPENLARAAEWMAAEFRKTGGKVELQPYTAFGSPFQNVSVLFDGPGDARVVVGAHYDAAPGTPGADDNASGVAGLMELATLLSKMELESDVELVAYCTEEPPYFGTTAMGSYAHARSLHEAGIKVLGMVSLEMIGFFSDEKGSQQYPIPALAMLYPSAGNFIAVVSRLDQRSLTGKVKRSMKKQRDLPVVSFVGPVSLNGIDFSDHRNYWKFDMPAVMVTNTAFFRNEHYHGVGDTADRLDYDRMRQVTEAVALAVRDLAGVRMHP
jgi:hypothetical protein